MDIPHHEHVSWVFTYGYGIRCWISRLRIQRIWIGLNLSKQISTLYAIYIYIYIYIYSLYIRSPGLSITRGSPGRTVQSGRAGPHPDVYKIGPGVLGFSFLRSTRFISDAVCDDDGCPRACAAVDLQPVAATPWPRRAVAEVPRSGVVAAVPRSVAAAPRSRGERQRVPCAGKRRRPRGPEEVALPTPASKRRPSTCE
jgi:hypothetical protein